MPIIEYPFTKFGAGVAHPMLWVKLVNLDTGLSLIALALIDTSADVCAFPTSVAKQLGYDLSDSPPKQIATASGVTLAYQHRVTLDILVTAPTGMPTEKVFYSLPQTPVDFIEGLNTILLGRPFLSNFVLEIDFKRELFSMRESKK